MKFMKLFFDVARGRVILVTVLLAAGAAACATARVSAQAEPGREREASGARTELPAQPKHCLLVRTIDTWKVLDRHRMLVYQGLSKSQAWLLEFETPCVTVRSAQELAFDTNDGQICGFRNDALLTGKERCMIGSIRPYEEPQGARAADSP